MHGDTLRWRSIELNGEGTAKSCNAGALKSSVSEMQRLVMHGNGLESQWHRKELLSYGIDMHSLGVAMI